MMHADWVELSLLRWFLCEQWFFCLIFNFEEKGPGRRKNLNKGLPDGHSLKVIFKLILSWGEQKDKKYKTNRHGSYYIAV